MNRFTTALCFAMALAGSLCVSQLFGQQPAVPAVPQVQQPPVAPPAAKPAAPLFKFDISADRADAIYKVGDKAVFKVKLLDKDGKPVEGAKIDYNLKGDFGFSSRGTCISAADGSISVDASLDKPGFILLTAYYTPEGAKADIKGLAGAGFDPLQIKAARPEPADFDEFWAKAKAELAAVPMKATATPVNVSPNQKGKIELFDVRIECAGGVAVSGYLAKPVGAQPKSLPARISFHGAGVYSSGKPVDKAEQGFIAMDVNAHGVENGKPAEFYKALSQGEFNGYSKRNPNDPQKIYFRGMFMRVMRALEYLKSQPEWDGKTLIVTGGSQGGAQTLVAGALDPQVSLCVAYVPAMCFHNGILDKQESGWPRFVSVKDGKPVDQAVVDTVAYYDCANMAKRIKGQCLLTTGFIDTTCSPTSVYVAFNNIPASNKRIINDIPCGHSIPKTTSAEAEEVIKAHVKEMKGEASK